MYIKIPTIDRLALPARLPASEAMKSFNQNEHDYHPDMWELQYVAYRRLGRLSDDELRDRYCSIVRNLRLLVSPGYDFIPIISFHSSWYWYRKEHQTRLEFALRGQEAPITLHDLEETISDVVAPVHPKFPNGTEVIFRYGKRTYMREMVDHGRIRFSPAQSYDDKENNEARRDEELAKHAYTPGQYVTLTHESGKPINLIGDIKHTVEEPTYHLVCFSCMWHRNLFEEFEADTCVIVSNPSEFAKRLQAAGQSVFPGWYFLDCPVEYFDPYEHVKNEYFSSAMSKDFRFAYQREYRILWSQMEADPVEGHQFVDIGPATDIMKIYDIDGTEVSF
jgi:hypothetical protein